MAGCRSNDWQEEPLEQHRLLRQHEGQAEQHPSRILQTLKASLPWSVVLKGGGPEVEGAEPGLCWELKQEPAVAVAHLVDQVAAALRFVALGVDEGMDKDGDEVVDGHIEPETCGEACCSRREAAAGDRGAGSAS